MSLRVRRFLWIAVVAACTVARPAAGQHVLTAADYQRAERAMSNAVVTSQTAAGQVTPNWLADGRFWYRASAGQFLLVDPARKVRRPAFDHARVAAALSKVAGHPIDAQHLPFTRITFTKDFKSIMVADSGKEWSCDANGSICSALAPGSIPAPAVSAGGVGGGRGGRGGGGRGGGGPRSHRERGG